MKINQLNKNGLCCGLWEYRRLDGSLMMKGAYVDGIKHGRWEEYYREFGSTNIDMIESEGNWEMGRKAGVWKYYYPSGELMNRLCYMSGFAHGFHENLFRNGKFRAKGFYKNKKPSGLWLISSMNNYEE